MKLKRIIITTLVILALGLLVACNEEVETTKNNDLDYALLIDSNGVFSYNGKKFDTLGDALKAVEKGSHDSSEKKITVTSNAVGYAASVGKDLENVVLDLGGNTITFIGVKESALSVGANTSLTLKNGTLRLFDTNTENLVAVSAENSKSLTLDGVIIKTEKQTALEAIGAEQVDVKNGTVLDGRVSLSGSGDAPVRFSADKTSDVTGVLSATGEASGAGDWDTWDVSMELDNDIEVDMKFAGIHVLENGHATILNKDTSSSDNKYLATNGSSAIIIPAGSAAVVDSGLCVVNNSTGVFYYGSLNEALLYDNMGQIIRMLDHDSLTIDKTLTVPYNVTIDLDGRTINPDGALMTISDGVTLTVTDSSASATESHFHPEIKSGTTAASCFEVTNTGSGSLFLHGSVTISGKISASGVSFEAISSPATIEADTVCLEYVSFTGSNTYNIEARAGYNAESNAIEITNSDVKLGTLTASGNGNISLVSVTGTSGAISTTGSDEEAESGVSGSISIDNNALTDPASGKTLETGALSAKFTYGSGEGEETVYGDVEVRGGTAGNTVTVTGIPYAKDVKTSFAVVTEAIGSVAVKVASLSDGWTEPPAAVEGKSRFRNDIYVDGAAAFNGTEFAANAPVRYLRADTLAITGATFNNIDGIYDLGAMGEDPSITVPALSITASTGTTGALTTTTGSIKADNTYAAADLTVTGNVSATAGFDVTLTGADGHPIFLEGDVSGKAVDLTYVTAKANADASESFSAGNCVLGDNLEADRIFSPAISISGSKIKLKTLASGETTPSGSVSIVNPAMYGTAVPGAVTTINTENLTIDALSSNLEVKDITATGAVSIIGGTYSGTVQVSGNGANALDCTYSTSPARFVEETVPVFKAGSTFTYNGGGSGTLLAKAGDFMGSTNINSASTSETAVTLDGSYYAQATTQYPDPKANPKSYSLRFYNIENIDDKTKTGSAYIEETDLSRLCTIVNRIYQTDDTGAVDTKGFVYVNYNPGQVVVPANGSTYNLSFGSTSKPAKAVLNIPATSGYGTTITGGLTIADGTTVTFQFGNQDYSLNGNISVQRNCSAMLRSSRDISGNVGSYYYDSTVPVRSNDKIVKGTSSGLNTYQAVPYSITYTPVENCTFSGTTTSYMYSLAKQEYTFTANPATNYAVDSITANISGVTVSNVSGNTWKLTIPAGTTGDLVLTTTVKLLNFSISYSYEHCSSVTYYYPSTVLPVEYSYSDTEDFVFKIVANAESGYGVVSFTSNISGVILEKDGLRYCNITIPAGTTGDLVVSVNTAEYKYVTYNYSGPGQFSGTQRAYFANQPFEQTLYFSINPNPTKSENPPSNINVSSSVPLSSYTYGIEDGVGKGTVVLPANAPEGITITVSKQ